MKKFLVTGVVTVSCSTVVEAKTKKEAIKLAGHLELADLCHGPFISEHDESFHFESDGTPKELESEDYYAEDDEE